MLQSIRDHAQGWLAWIIVGLISIPFALWGIQEYLNPAAQVIIAEVNDVELRREEFDYNVQRQTRQLQSRFGDSFDPSVFRDRVKQDVLKNMIEEEVLIQSALDSNMRVGDAVLAGQVKTIPAFQQNGKFSQSSYEQTLRYQGMTPATFEYQMRRALLVDQLERGIVRTAAVPAEENKTYQALQKQQRLLSYALISPEHFTDIEVSDEEAETYYQEHETTYVTPEKVSLEYVELSSENLSGAQQIEEKALRKRYDEQRETFTEAPKWKARHILIEDGDGALEKANELRTKITAGGDFAKLAEEFSADKGSAAKGGDLGEFGPGAMVQPFEDAVRALKSGEISEPVKSRFGYHIIEVLESTPESIKAFEDVREELLTQMQKEQAEKEFYDMQEQFANTAFEQPDNLDVLAETMKLEKKTTELFERGLSGGKGILAHSKVIDAAFSEPVLKQGMNSEVLELGEQNLAVVRVSQHEESKPRPFEEVKEEITKILKKQKQNEAAEKLGKTLLEELGQGKSRQESASAHGLEWTKLQWVERRDFKFEQQDILREAFKLGHPAPQQVIYKGLSPMQGGYAVVALFDVHEETKTEEKEKTPPQHGANIAQTEFQLLTAALRGQAEIKIHQQNLSDETN